MQSNKAVVIKNLVKKYGNYEAVKGISLEVEKGEIFGILGPNGAGKTTTLEILEGLRNKTSGIVKVLGQEVSTSKGNKMSKLRQQVGIQLQSSAYFQFLRLDELLSVFGSFYSRNISASKLLELVKLQKKSKEFVRNLSGGQAQRFSIIAALVNDPELVFLDEPTTGLDPNIRRQLWSVIKKINSEGKTIILTTHYMEEAQMLCDRVAIMDSGKIVAIDSPQGMIEKFNMNFKIRFILNSSNGRKTNKTEAKGDVNSRKNLKLSSKNKTILIRLEKLKYVHSVRVSETNNRKIEVEISDVSYANDLLNWLERHKTKFTRLEVLPPTLEDVFLKLTGKKLNV